MDIESARTDEAIRACYPVFKQLRPHLGPEEFFSQAKRQMAANGYSIICIAVDGKVVAAAGYRVAEFLAWGKALYVDDLITDEAERKHGYAGALMDWLMEEARKNGCKEFHLDSGVHRFDAHRLYLNKKMIISSHHFSLVLR